MPPADPETESRVEDPGASFDLLALSLDSFETRSLEDKWPSFPGIYALSSPLGAELYVGQSKDVRSRLLAHRREKKWWSEVHEIRTFELHGDAESRLVAETGLILRYRPRHNRAIKIGLRLDGSLYEIQFIRGKR